MSNDQNNTGSNVVKYAKIAGGGLLVSAAVVPGIVGAILFSPILIPLVMLASKGNKNDN